MYLIAQALVFAPGRLWLRTTLLFHSSVILGEDS